MPKIGVSRNRALQNLMTGLIYPAVLGTILFSVLQLAESNIRTAFGFGQYVFSYMMTLKFLLLLVTLAFYVCDYLYAIYTRDYIPKFFVLDSVFVIFLYATVRVIDIEGGETLEKGWLLALIYMIFMLFYRWWDGGERRNCIAHPEKCMPGEENFYGRVLKWERRSIVWLAACFLLLLRWQNSATLTLFLIVLGAVTRRFWRYAWEKKSFYFDPDSEPSTDQEEPNPGLNRTDTALSRGTAG